MKEPLSFYKANDGIKFYLVNCGSGLTHLIVFPDDTVMLFDCNLIDDAEHPNRNKDYIYKRANLKFIVKMHKK